MNSSQALHKKLLGNTGESIATSYLQRKGYRIIERNFKARYGEIDIICIYQNTLVFVEVKTRTALHIGYPEESITPRKAKHMLRCAEMYAGEHDIDHWQVDAIAVEGTRGMTPKITHFENVLS